MKSEKNGSDKNAVRNLPSEDGAGLLFQPDTLSGDQYFANFRRKSFLEPEKSLMLAILEDGVRTFQDNFRATSGKKRLLFEEAEKWLSSDDTGWTFSFALICAHLGFDPGYIRRGLRDWLEREQEKGRKEPAKLAPMPKRRAA
jgi:hypothetical protein